MPMTPRSNRRPPPATRPFSAAAGRSCISPVVALTAGLIGFGFDPMRVIIAMISFYLIVRIGLAILGAFARPIPEPPPPGELRRVKLVYRCSSCGAELRMTLANDQVPQPPRHCADEMDLLTSVDEL